MTIVKTALIIAAAMFFGPILIALGAFWTVFLLDMTMGWLI